MRIYYAHHLWKYDTKIEQYEIELIYKSFSNCKVVNPNGDIAHKDLSDENEIMKECLQKVKECDSLAFSSMDGIVGHGVVDEINCAFGNNKPVYYIDENQVSQIRSISWNIINDSNRIYAIPRLINYM